MKIKLDENLPSELIEDLAVRHDVHTVHSEGLVGRNDRIVFEAASAEGRFFITQDMDFSDIRRFQPGTHPGLMLLRLRSPSRRLILERFRQLLREEDFESWSGCFVVLSDRKLRIHRP